MERLQRTQRDLFHPDDSWRLQAGQEGDGAEVRKHQLLETTIKYLILFEEGVIYDCDAFCSIIAYPSHWCMFIMNCIMKYWRSFIFVIILFSMMVVYSGCENPNDENNYIEPEMILIDKDLTFTNGPSWDSTFYEIVDSLPMITLEPYYIGKYELTNEEYYLFVKDGGYRDSFYWSQTGWQTKNDSSWTKPKYWSKGEKPWEEDPFSNKKNTPVHAISYYEAEAYCAWLSDKTGKNYHIPYSTQWVRAAKGPDPGTKYTWGNEFNEANAHYPLFTYSDLVPVTNYPNGRSYEGCYNMIGNLYEICFRIPDEWGDFLLIYSYHSGTCSEPICMMETMTTTGGGSVERYIRRDAVGLRICRD